MVFDLVGFEFVFDVIGLDFVRLASNVLLLIWLGLLLLDWIGLNVVVFGCDELG